MAGAVLVTCLLCTAALLKARAGARWSPETLCGLRLPAVALGVVLGSLGPQLGFMLKLTFIAVSRTLFHEGAIYADMTLVLLIVVGVVGLAIVDFCPAKRGALELR